MAHHAALLVERLAFGNAGIREGGRGEDRKAKNSRPWLNARVADISGCGIGLWIESKSTGDLEIGRSLELRIRFQSPSGAQSIVTRAQVRRIRPSPDRIRATFAGIEFELGDSEEDDGVEALVALEAAADAGALGRDLGRAGRVVPEAGLVQLPVELAEAARQRRGVKGNHGPTRGGP